MVAFVCNHFTSIEVNASKSCLLSPHHSLYLSPMAFAPSSKLYSCADCGAQDKLFRLFSSKWVDLAIDVPETLDEALNILPSKGIAYQRICVDCELARRKKWLRLSGETEDAVALQLTDKPTNNDGALVVEGSRGSDTASGSGDVEPSLPKFPWASKEAIRQDMTKAKR